jgi:hypothetical protein
MPRLAGAGKPLRYRFLWWMVPRELIGLRVANLARPAMSVPDKQRIVMPPSRTLCVLVLILLALTPLTFTPLLAAPPARAESEVRF